jgi:ABC-2 type transport system permease protein
MNRFLFLYEFKTRLRSVFWWALSSSLVILLYMVVYPSFAEDMALVSKTMAAFPPEFRAAFRMRDVDISTLLGYFTFIYLFLQIFLAIQAGNYGVGLVSVEEREKTADFLLTRPLTRSRILTSKILAAFASLFLTDIWIWASAFAFVYAFRGTQPFDSVPLAKLLFALIPFQLYFFAVGLFLSLLVRRVKNVPAWGMALGLSMYAFGAFGDMMGETFLEKITPFRYFDPHDFLSLGHFDPAFLAAAWTVIVLALAASYWRYLRRDIYSGI